MPVLIPADGQQLAVNGTDLSQYAAITFSNAPLMGTPAKRAKNVTVPGRHGTIHTPRKKFNEADFVLKFLVLGAQADGTIPGGSTAAKELYARADALMSLFAAGDTVTLTRTMPDASVRQCVAEVVDKPMDWTRQLGYRPLIAEVTVPLIVPAGFWFDVTPVTSTITGVTGTSATLTAFQGATAPMENLTITFGPCSNPSISQGATVLTYNGVVAAGKQLVVSTATWLLSTGTGTAWTPSYSAITYTPGPAWFSLDPTQALSVSFGHTEASTATVTITGPRAYLSA